MAAVRNGPRCGQCRQSGLALVIVLWLLALLGLLTASLASGSRNEIRTIATQTRMAEARALAESGIWLGIADLSQADAARRWDVTGRDNDVQFRGERIRVRVQDEAGRVDLNQASAALLTGLMLQAGADRRQSQAIVSAIMARREQDTGPGTAAYYAINELLDLTAMDAGVYERVEPLLTVFTNQPGINPAVAPREVLLALPGADPQSIETYLAQRFEARRRRIALPDLTTVNPRYLRRTGGRLFSIRATGYSGPVSQTTEAVVRFVNRGEKPYVILAWREGLAGTAATDDETADG